MLIELNKILKKFGVSPKGVIHCGIHHAQEHDEYIKCGIERFVYIEPCKEAFSILTEKIKDERAILINVACGAEEKEATMYVSHQNLGMSNSLLEPVLHLIQHPDIKFDDTEVVKIVTMDSLPIEKEKYSLLCMDCEGYEGEILKGAAETIKYIDIIYTEIQRGETRRGNILIEDLDEYLWGKDFVRVETYWPGENLTWGDAIYLKKSIYIENFKVYQK